MKNIGYITLSEAEKISGIKADTLKKKCQDGRMSGAIKQGNVWYVPKSEIIKSDKIISKDILLAILGSLAEAGVETGVTLLVGGKFITGNLISEKRYLDEVSDLLKGAVEDKKIPDDIEKMFKKIFESSGMNKKLSQREALEKPIHFLHLNKVKIRENNELSDVNRGLIRIKLHSVDGFIWGNMS